MSDEKSIGRFAFRREGHFVNAYLAGAKNMDDATLLASIRVHLLESGEGFWDAYRELLKSMFHEFSAQALGVDRSDIAMPEHAAPEHEKSGNA